MMTRSNDFTEYHGPTHPGVRLALIVGAAAAVYACDTATGPKDAPIDTWGRALPVSAVTPGVTMLCQVGLGARFQVRVGVLGSNPTPQAVSVADGNCTAVATIDPASKDDVIVRIEESEGSYYALDHIVLQHGEEAPRTMRETNSVSFEGAHGALVTFFNNAAVNVCEAGGIANFQYQVGLQDEFRALALSDGQCSRIATIRPASADDVVVTVRQASAVGFRLDQLNLALGELPLRSILDASTVSFEGLHGGTVTFRHSRLP